MKVNPISSVRFTSSAEEMLSRPGAFTNVAERENIANQPKEKKSSSAKKIAIGTLATAAIILGGAAALKHFAPNTFKILSTEELANAKFTQKATHYVATIGDWLISHTNSAVEGIKNLFKKTPEV